MSKLKVNEIDSKTGTTVTVTTGKTLDIPAGGTLTVAGTQTVTGTTNLTGATLTLPATLPATALTNATNIPAAQLSGQVPVANLGNVDTSGLEADIALLAFKTQANGSLARYNLIDQSVDSFEDASGVDAGASTNESRSLSNYYYGGTLGAVTYHASTTTGASTWTCPSGIESAEILVIGGGGGGATAYGSGGGAGGIVHDTDYTVVAGVVYDITVGTGGATVTGQLANDGANSVFNVNAEGSGITLTANGGGGGGATGGPNSGNGREGGSGGGSGNTSSGQGATNQPSFPGALSYGNAGGFTGPGTWWGAGGGGAGGVGGNGQGPPEATGYSGNGGVGKLFSNFLAYGTNSSNAPSSGSDGGWFGGGGGGGAENWEPSNNTGGLGGTGGGGINYRGTQSQGTGGSGIANTGGGGSGATTSSTNQNSGSGGTGVVLLRYQESVTGLNMTLVSNAQTAQTAPTKGDLVMTISNGAGTTNLNVDVKAYISRDGSAYTSAVTLVSKGTTAGHQILTANDVDLSGITSGTSMRWKIETLNQSAGVKETRIQAVSLGWS